MGLAIMTFSLQTNASTINLVNGIGSFGNTVSGDFTDTWTFTAPANAGIFTLAFNGEFDDESSITVTGVIENFSGTLDGKPISEFFNDGGLTVLFDIFPGTAAGLHTLILTGFAKDGASYQGLVGIAQTPIPAGIWLFGSALMGMMGVKRRKQA